MQIWSGHCQFFRQLIISISMMIILPVGFASELYHYYDGLNDIYLARRATASFNPGDEVIYSPFTQRSRSWIEQLMVDDEARTLEQMRQTIQNWQQMEEYSRLWNLESTGLYQTPPSGDKMNYLSKNMIRYIDKRIAGEVKNAKEGSTLRKIGEVQEALRPSGQIAVSAKVKVKMRLQVLQGQASIQLHNPWINFIAQGTASGKLKIAMEKKIDQWGGMAEFKYEAHYDKWTATYEQLIAEHWKARVGAEKIGDFSFYHYDQKHIQFVYVRPF